MPQFHVVVMCAVALVVTCHALAVGPVVVVGSTGRVGRQIVKQLVNKGVETRCLVRDKKVVYS
jgi:hypothetical protein